jgi:hypothetical protein
VNLLLSLKAEGKKILHIKDESHIDASIDSVISEYSDKTLYMSATPKRSIDVVEMKEERSLLRQELVLKDLTKEGIDIALDTAMSDLKEITPKYNKKNINPVLLVQVNDDDKSEKTYQHIKKHVVAKAKKHELK